MPQSLNNAEHVAIVGGGPAGLMAADVVSEAGARVTIYDRMPSLGRKFLMAGRGGLNLTHSEPLEVFLTRYGPDRTWLEPAIRAFPPPALIAFVHTLGQETFVGSSGRVFPKVMKASPLLRAWLQRLDQRGVAVRLKHRWTGFSDDGGLTFVDGDGRAQLVRADAVILALGGGSWARLGSDGAWCEALQAAGIATTPLQPANCGVLITWSPHIGSKFAGTPLKRIALTSSGTRVRGEALVTAAGLEGNAVYSLSRTLRMALATSVRALIALDLRPDMSAEDLTRRLAKPRGKDSVSNWLRKVVSLSPVEIALLREVAGGALPSTSADLAALIKELRFTVTGLAPMDRAISTAGGVAAAEVDATFMLRRRPGVFVAGEMLDWDAPTGGYLLQAAMATGREAGLGALGFLGRPRV